MSPFYRSWRPLHADPLRLSLLRARPLITRLQDVRSGAIRSKLFGQARLFTSTGLSISSGPDDPPLLPHTIPEHFAETVLRFGDLPALICRSPTTSKDHFHKSRTHIPPPLEDVYTYEKLDISSNSLGHALRNLGVKKGDRVAVSLGNCQQFAVLTYAIFKLGAILVPLNPGFGAKEVTAALNHLGAEILIIGAVTDLAYKPCRGRDNLPLLQAMVPDLDSGKIESPTIPSLRKIIVVDNSPYHPAVASPLAKHSSLTSYNDLVNIAHSPIVPDSPLSPSETINIQFTSGTTSHPKAAKLSHTSILNNGALIANRMGLEPSDRIVCPPPLFHCFGSVLGYMATATTGATIIFPSPAFDPLASLRAVADHRATGLYGVSTMFVAMLEVLAARAEASASSSPTIAPETIIPQDKIRDFPSHLHKGIAAGSSIPESLMRKLHGTLGLQDLVICYGMTETSPVSCMTAPHDPLAKRVATVGRVMPHTRVKIVDPHDRSRVVPVGERGELAAAGYLVMEGYWGDEERTREVLVYEEDEDGKGEGTAWMYSGDEAVMDEEGFVAITGRIKDLIIRGGENIHPLAIENALFQHPLVAEASVVGVSDERYGESVAAFVIPHQGVAVVEDEEEHESLGSKVAGQQKVLTKKDVREWVGSHLSKHMVPKHVFWADEFPKTASGKIQKFKLRDIAERWVTPSEEADDLGSQESR